jgi:hypothetical protein
VENSSQTRRINVIKTGGSCYALASLLSVIVSMFMPREHTGLFEIVLALVLVIPVSIAIGVIIRAIISEMSGIVWVIFGVLVISAILTFSLMALVAGLLGFGLGFLHFLAWGWMDSAGYIDNAKAKQAAYLGMSAVWGGIIFRVIFVPIIQNIGDIPEPVFSSTGVVAGALAGIAVGISAISGRLILFGGFWSKLSEAQADILRSFSR